MGEFEHDSEALLAQVSHLRTRLQTAEATAATFRALVENQRDLLLYSDAKGRLLYVSPSYCALHGKREAELVGTQWWPPIHPEDEALVRASLDRLHLPPYETSHVERVYTTQGLRWLAWWGHALLDESGQVRGFVALGRDITEERLAYQALAQSAQRLRQIIDLVPMHIFAKDAQGRFILANEAVAADAGFPAQDLIGQTDAAFHEGEAAVRRYVETDQIVLRTGQPWESAEERVVRSTGAVNYLHKRKIPFTTESGEPAVLGVSMDITEQVMAQRALRESQERFAAFFDSSPVGLCVLDRDLRYVLINSALAKMNGHTIAEHLGRSIEEVLDDATVLRPLFERTLADGEVINEALIRAPRPEHVAAFCRMTCFPLGEGEHRLVGVVVVNVTESERATRALAASEARLRGLYEGVQAGVVVLATDGRIVHANRVAVEILGLPQDDILGRTAAAPVWRMVDEAGAEMSAEEHPSSVTLRTGQPVHGAVRGLYTGVPQRLAWLMINSEPVSDPTSGELIEVVVTFADISARIQAEHALRENEARLRSLYESVQAGVVVVDQQGRVVHANRAAAELVGAPQSRITGASLRTPSWRMVDESGADLPRADYPIPYTLRTGQPVRNVVRGVYYGAPERLVWLMINTEPVSNPASGELIEVVLTFADITARIQVEQSLRASEGRLRGLYEGVQAGVIVQGTDGRLVHANRAAAEIMGLSQETILGLTSAAPVWRMIDEVGADVPPEEHPSMITLRTGQPVRGAVRGLYTGEPERLVWLMINTEPVHDPATGAVQEVVITFTDISGHMAAEQALRESETRFRAVFEHAGSGMARVDLTGNLLEVNPALGEMLGYRPAELEGCPLSDITHPGDIDADLALYAELVAGQRQDYQIEKRYLHRDGRVLWGRLTATMVRDAQGQPLFGLGSVLDVTAQRIAAEALAESEARYRTLFEQTANPILVIDTEGRYLEANQAALTFLETDRETLLTCTVRELAPTHEGAEAMLTQHAELWRIGGRADAEYQIGSRRKILDLTITPAQWRGRDVVFAVGRDVTEQRRLEERLREMNKLEAIGQLAGGVAHEFNNLLTVINGNAEMLAETLGPSHRGHHDTQEILHAGHRAADLVQQLLAFGRRQMVSVQVLDLRDVLGRSAAMLRQMLPERVLLDVAIAAETGAVRGDPSQFDQILLSLGSNARDAMPLGGTLTVRTGNIRFDEPYINGKVALDPGSYVLLEVVDTGVGMTDEVMQHLFEPFFSTKEVGQGSGLGLAAVYGIVKQLGGEIEVESRLGRGTCFRIYLPQVGAPALQTSPLDLEAQRTTVLVVEDEPAVRRLAVRMLNDLGYRALEAMTAQQALELCRREQGRIALMLADVGMPGMSGLELARAMGPDCPDVPILYMTGYGMQAVEGEQPATVRGVIAKPFTRAQLAHWVERIVGAP